MTAPPLPLPRDLVAAIMEAWAPLSQHAQGCPTCRDVYGRLLLAPDDPHPLYDRCCPEGQRLWTPWADAKVALEDHLKARAQPWGLAGLQPAEQEERAAALTGLSDVAAKDIYETADPELREAKIHGVIAAERSRRRAEDAERRAGERLCDLPGCGVWFTPPPRSPNKRYCSDAHRARGHDLERRLG